MLASALIPWLLSSVIEICENASLRGICRFAAVVAGLLLIGYPQLPYYALLFGGIGGGSFFSRWSRCVSATSGCCCLRIGPDDWDCDCSRADCFLPSLRYANQSMLSAGLLFEHPRTAAGDADMQVITRKPIDAALPVGGRYYLPYRLCATQRSLIVQTRSGENSSNSNDSTILTNCS